MPYGRLIITVDANVRPLEVTVRNASTRAGEQAAQSIGQSLQHGLRGVGSVLKGVGQAAATGLTGATAAAAAFGVSSFRAAARVGEMNASLKALAQANKQSYPEMLKQVTAIRRSGIEANVAQDLVAQFSRNQLDLAQSTKLARVAQDLAVISGRNSTEVLSDLTHGIMTNNTQVLRNAGSNVMAGQALAAYAKQLGKNQNELSSTERAQAILNAVIEDGSRVAGAYETAMQEPGKVLRSFRRVIDDVKVSVGEGLVQAFGPLILLTYDLVKAFSEAVAEGGVLHPIFGAIGEAVQTLITPLNGLVKGWSAWIKSLSPEQVERITAAIRRFGPVVLAAVAALSALTAPALLSGIPGLGTALSALMAPATALGGQLASIGAAAAGPMGLGLTSGGAAAGTFGAALGSLALPVTAVVAGIALLAVASTRFRNAILSFGRAILAFFAPVISALVSGFRQLLPPLWAVVRAVGDALAPIFERLAPILAPLGQLLGQVLRLAFAVLVPIVRVLGAVLVLLISIIGWVLDKVLALIVPVVLLAIRLSSLIVSVLAVINPFRLLGSAISVLIGWIQSLVRWITGGSPGLIPAFQALAAVASSAMSFISSVVSAAMSGIVAAVRAAVAAVTSIVANGWSAVRAGTQTSWAAISAVISNAWAGIRAQTSSSGSWMTSFLANLWAQINRAAGAAWTGIVRTIASAWNGVRDAVAAPARWVVGTIINPLVRGINGLISKIGIPEIPAIPAFAGGGKIPGTGRGDKILMWGEPGEWMLTRGQARAIGYDTLARLPRYQEGGEVSPGGGVGFAPTGFALPFRLPNIGGIARGAWDKTWGFTKEILHLDQLASLGSELVDTFSGMLRKAAAAAFKLLVTPLRNAVEPLASGSQVFPGQWLGKTALQVIDKAIEWIEGQSVDDYMGGGAGIDALVREVIGRFPGLVITSALRPGDTKSYHSRNMARDLGGPVSLMDAAARWIGEGMYRELIEGIFNPSLSVKNGAKVPPSFWGAGTWAGHRDHIHMAAAEGDGGGPAGSGVQRWRPLVQQIAGMLGIGHTVDAWLRQIQTESGGNEKIVQQIRDINWPHNLARGLLQVIPTTFAAQRGNPFGTNIFDPRANIWAAMKYAIGRYGGNLLNVIGRGHGYAGGGIVGEPVIGLGMRSGTPYSFAERGPELVSPLGRYGDPRLAAQRGTTINVYPQPGQDPREIAAMVSRELAWAAAGGGV